MKTDFIVIPLWLLYMCATGAVLTIGYFTLPDIEQNHVQCDCAISNKTIEPHTLSYLACCDTKCDFQTTDNYTYFSYLATPLTTCWIATNESVVTTEPEIDVDGLITFYYFLVFAMVIIIDIIILMISIVIFYRVTKFTVQISSQYRLTISLWIVIDYLYSGIVIYIVKGSAIAKSNGWIFLACFVSVIIIAAVSGYINDRFVIRRLNTKVTVFPLKNES